jgi:2-polyprenyl-3-methyl-5-hydroxy-6-metoxy-1,4-benzoquinol methylase
MIEVKSILTIPTGATPLRIQLASDNLMSPPTDPRTYGAPRHPAQSHSTTTERRGVEEGGGRPAGDCEQKRALDIGCAVGGTCFELARSFAEVIGLDQSAALVAAANSMRTQGKLELFRTVRAWDSNRACTTAGTRLALRTALPRAH